MIKDFKRLISSERIKACLCEFDDCYARLTKRIDNIDILVSKLSSNGIVIRFSEDGITKGIVCFYANDSINHCGYISIIWVNKDYRNEGIGTALLEFCLDDMRKRGMIKAQLEVEEDNKRAISFYRKNGFAIMNRAQENSFYMVRSI